MDIEILQDVIKKAKSLGADSVDLMLVERKGVSVSTRLTKLENLTQSEIINVDMRVFIGKKSANVVTNNIRELQEDAFVEKAVAVAKNSPEEIVVSRADASKLCKNFKEMDIFDPTEVHWETLLEGAVKCESVALQVNGITNSGGAQMENVFTRTVLLKSEGFVGEYDKSVSSIVIETLGEKDGELQRDYSYSNAVYYADMKTPEQVALEAADMTVRKLGSRKIKSCKVPVLFYKRVGRSILKSMMDALNGSLVAKGTSFLKDKLSQKVFGDRLNVSDRYDTARGLRSRPFDADGLECVNTDVISSGVVNSFLLNTKYANKLGMTSTANSSGWDGIAPHNICIENGDKSFDDLLKSIKSGLFVVDVLGHGLNVITGNYSQGAAGFWIENGEISYPVHEITIAGNFIDMFSNCLIGSDLEMNSGFGSPSILLEEMVVGGI
ncbi:modulator protein [Alphaproteobacteria bacterium]|nr:modulator protein [Alphaproteobacteria bacterium]